MVERSVHNAELFSIMVAMVVIFFLITPINNDRAYLGKEMMVTAAFCLSAKNF